MWYKIQNQDEGRRLNWVLGAGALRGGCGDRRAAHVKAGLCHQAAHLPRVRGGGQGQWGAKPGSPGVRGVAQKWAAARAPHTLSRSAHRSACHLRGCVGRCESYPGQHRVGPGGEGSRRLGHRPEAPLVPSFSVEHMRGHLLSPGPERPRFQEFLAQLQAGCPLRVTRGHCRRGSVGGLGPDHIPTPRPVLWGGGVHLSELTPPGASLWGVWGLTASAFLGAGISALGTRSGSSRCPSWPPLW